MGSVTNPLFDRNGFVVDQTGCVWFLSVSFLSEDAEINFMRVSGP